MEKINRKFSDEQENISAVTEIYNRIKALPYENPCSEQPNCSDVNCQLEIAGYHELTEFEFYTVVTAYYAEHDVDITEIPEPLIKTREEIDALVNADCAEFRIVFDLNEDDITTHHNISLNRVAGYHRPPGQVNTYAISMFKGILQRDPYEFRFYRAKGFNPGTGNTLAISAFYANGLAAYFGDLTDVYPMR